MKVGEQMQEEHRKGDLIYVCNRESKVILAIYEKSQGWQEQTALDDYLLKENEKERTRCEVWTRVMGYHRPVSEFNPGKQSEHTERQHFSEDTAMKRIEEWDEES